MKKRCNFADFAEMIENCSHQDPVEADDAEDEIERQGDKKVH